jgi:hypothetical protein
VPSDVTVDARLPQSGYLASGHWPNPDPSAGGSAIIVHGPNAANTARFTLFGIDPLVRAHPERSFPAVSAGFYWGDISRQPAAGRPVGARPLKSPWIGQVLPLVSDLRG